MSPFGNPQSRPNRPTPPKLHSPKALRSISIFMQPDGHPEKTADGGPATESGLVSQSDNRSDIAGVHSSTDFAEEVFPIDSQCLAKLAQGSSVLIASLLAIPDAVALLPGATSALGWLLGLIGVWISAAVLWFVGFLGILQVMRLLVKGVSVGPNGIKLWRLAKPILWEKLDAVTVEPQVTFSKLFSLNTTAQKLTLYSRFISDKKIFQKILVPNPVPSFLFKPEVFDKLVRAILKRKFELEPVSTHAVFVFPNNQAPLRTTSKALKYQQILVTILIAIGLVGLLGRKAAVNYVYNSGNRALAAKDLLEAERLYSLATEIDPFFYAPFNNLANVEFRRGDFAQALRNWEKALRLKPDFVEPMISISYLHLQKGEYARAKELINSALLLAPLNSHALVNRADYFVRMGNVKAAMTDATNVIAKEKTEKDKRPVYTAQCILSQGMTLSGKPQEALKKLDAMAQNFNELEFNRTLWLLSKAEALLALDDYKAAYKTGLEAQRRAGNSRDVLILLTRISLARADDRQAQGYVDQLSKLAVDDPWTNLLQARLLTFTDKKRAEKLVETALQLSRDNANVYAEAALVFVLLQQPERAQLAAQKALQLEPLNAPAFKLLEEMALRRRPELQRNESHSIH